MLFKQCKLQKDNVSLITWIPEFLAKKDKVLRRKVDNMWIEGWQVVEVYNNKQKEYEDASSDSHEWLLWNKKLKRETSCI